MSIRHLPDSPPPFASPRKRAAVWSAARADYLAGAGAPEVCERHGLALSTFRWRAKQEGWRRTDRPFPEPAPFVAPPEAAPQTTLQTTPQPQAASPAMAETEAETPPQDAPQNAPQTAAEMARSAWDASRAAVAAGRLIEARGWLRLHRDLHAMAVQEQREKERQDRAREAAERRAFNAEMDQIDADIARINRLAKSLQTGKS